MSASRRNRRPAAPFWGDTSAVSAIEFALIAPLILALVLGAFDTYRFIYTTQRMQTTANAMATMIATTPPDNPIALSSVGTLNDDLVNAYHNSVWLLYPDFFGASSSTIGGWWNLQTNFALIKMTSTGGGNYKPSTQWVTTDNGTTPRTCTATYNIIANDAPPDVNSLPQGAIGPSQLIVVDVIVPFQSLFVPNLFPKLNLMRTAYANPRYVSSLTYQSNWSLPQGMNCPSSGS